MKEWRNFANNESSEDHASTTVKEFTKDYERLDCLPSADFTNSASLGDQFSKDSRMSGVISSESQTRCILAKVQNVKAIHDFNNIVINKQ